MFKIVYWADFHKGETVHGAASRFWDYGSIPSAKLTKQLFGSSEPIDVGLPTRLNHLLSVMPENHNYTSIEIIQNHTLLPLYAPFMTEEKVKSAIEKMQGDTNVGGLKWMTGVSGHKQGWIVVLRYCPVCAKKDREHYGYTFWHLIHQVPGLIVCPEDGAFLVTAVQVPIQQQLTVVADKLIPNDLTPTYLNKLNPDEAHHLMLAQQVQRLHQNPIANVLKVSTKQLFWPLLERQGFIAGKRDISQEKLAQSFTLHYGTEFLESIDCVLIPNTNDITWLKKMLRDYVWLNTNYFHSILLANFLEVDILDLLQNDPIEIQKWDIADIFGKGPWACINKFCDNYREKCIYEYQPSSWVHSPAVIFTCEYCGLSHRVNQRPYEIANGDLLSLPVRVIITHGPTWNSKLEKLWLDPNNPMDKLIYILDAEAHHLIKQAYELGLPIPRDASAGLSKAEKKVLDMAHKLDSEGKQLLEKHQQILLDALEKYPNESRTFFRQQYRSTVEWLARNVPDWLEDNLPESTPNTLGGYWSDWTRRDHEFAALVNTAVETLMNLPGLPVRITFDAIRKQIRLERTQEFIKENMTETYAEISKYEESDIDFAVRRLWFYAKTFSGAEITRAKLITKASVYNYREDPRIINALDEIMKQMK